jgi:hypothetical protein
MIRCSRPASRAETLQLLRKVCQPLLPDFPRKRHRRLLGTLDLAHLQPARHRGRHDLGGMSVTWIPRDTVCVRLTRLPRATEAR